MLCPWMGAAVGGSLALQPYPMGLEVHILVALMEIFIRMSLTQSPKVTTNSQKIYHHIWMCQEKVSLC